MPNGGKSASIYVFFITIVYSDNFQSESELSLRRVFPRPRGWGGVDARCDEFEAS